MLILFASLNAIDGICCPDGCTHEEESTSQQHTTTRQTAPASCALAASSSAGTGATPSGIVTNRPDTRH